jgi:hypothetical protein
VDGYRISSHDTNDEFDCLNNCNAQPECSVFTFNPETNFCELRNNCSGIAATEACPNCLSGERNCRSG